MNRHLIAAAILSLMAFAACKKSITPSVTKVFSSDTTFRFINNNPYDLHVDMYSSSHDRDNHLNVLYSCDVPLKGNYKIPFSMLDTQATYYYDVYTPDKTRSNWYGNSQGFPLFYTGHTFNLNNFLPLKKYSYFFLEGDAISTAWIAVDKLSKYNYSQWANMDADSRYLRLVINRNGTGAVTRKLSGGAMDIDNINSFNSDPDSNKIHIVLATSISPIEYSVFACPVVPDYNYNNRTSRDTILLDNYSEYWVMVRD